MSVLSLLNVDFLLMWFEVLLLVMFFWILYFDFL